MKRVAIIGADCATGLELCRHLGNDPSVEAVIAIGEGAIDADLSGVEFIQRGGGDELGDIVLESWIDSAIYLAYQPGVALPASSHQLEGLESVLSACHRGGLAGLVVGSSARVYGPSWERPAPRQEGSPLEAERLPYPGLQGLVAVENRLRSFVGEHPEMNLAVARPVSILSAGVDDLIGGALRRRPVPVLPSPLAPIQACHGQDYARALVHLLERGASGAYNVAPSDVLGVEDIAEMIGPKPMFLRSALLRRGLGVGKRFGLGPGESAQEALTYLGAPWLADGQKLRESLGFRFGYSSRQALGEYLAAQPTAPRKRLSRRSHLLGGR